MAWDLSDKEERKTLMKQLGFEYREKCLRQKTPKGIASAFTLSFKISVLHCLFFFSPNRLSLSGPLFGNSEQRRSQSCDLIAEDVRRPQIWR